MHCNTQRGCRRPDVLVVTGSSMFIKPRLTSFHLPFTRVITASVISTKELNIQTDGSHEQIDITKTLPAHVLR
jgi:hypothetical protein